MVWYLCIFNMIIILTYEHVKISLLNSGTIDISNYRIGHDFGIVI